MKVKLDRGSFESLYILKRAGNQMAKSIITLVQTDARFAYRHHVSMVCRKLSSLPFSFLDEADIKTTMCEYGVKFIAEKAEHLLNAMCECVTSELRSILWDHWKGRIRSVQGNRQVGLPEMEDLDVAILDLEEIGEFEEMILDRRRIDDSQLRRFLVFGFFVQIYHPACANPHLVHLYLDISLNVLFWRAIIQKLHEHDFLAIDRVREIVLGHSTVAWTQISNRKRDGLWRKIPCLTRA
jgi:hypothetical protein